MNRPSPDSEISFVNFDELQEIEEAKYNVCEKPTFHITDDENTYNLICPCINCGTSYSVIFESPYKSSYKNICKCGYENEVLIDPISRAISVVKSNKDK